MKRYISYFQSVMTIGIMSSGNSHEEAEKEAEKKFHDKNGINYCYFDQTPFELTDSDVWSPEFEVDEKNSKSDGIKFDFSPSDKTKAIIAERLHKNVKDLSQDDYEIFVQDAIDFALKH